MDKELALDITDLGKMYKLYKNPKDKIFDAFGIKRRKKDYYREFWALRDINIKINKGERVGFIGHNGAGKSTLLKIIVGNILQTEGSMKVDGRIQALLEIGTGFHPEFTGRENIYASLVYQGKMNKDEMRLKEEEIIDFTELGEYIDQPVRTYSAGMYARLAFATATAVCPEILIIDEVLGVGDAYFNGKCVERMQKLTRDEGATVLFVSHDLQSIQNLCDRVIWIDKGRVRYDGETLTGIKLYTQAVRKNEEMRLRIRDMKHIKNEAIVVDRKLDLYNQCLFRIRPLRKEKNMLCKIYSIKAFVNNLEVAYIDIGGPMDNNYSENNYIMDATKNTNWGSANSDEKGFFREILDSAEKTAEFQLLISKEYQLRDVVITIESTISESGYSLQLFDVECNSVVDIGFQEEAGGFLLSTVYDQEDEVVDKVETQDVKIGEIFLRDKLGKTKKVFAYEAGISECEIEVFFKQRRYSFVISFLVYAAKGDLILSTAQRIELSEFKDDIRMIVSFPKMKMAPGEYTISIGIYDDLDVKNNTKEQKFLALLDRGISFKIEQPRYYGLNVGYYVSDSAIQIKGLEEEKVKCSLMI